MSGGIRIVVKNDQADQILPVLGILTMFRDPSCYPKKEYTKETQEIILTNGAQET